VPRIAWFFLAETDRFDPLRPFAQQRKAGEHGIGATPPQGKLVFPAASLLTVSCDAYLPHQVTHKK
jgi:hypothetical protein